jgi:thymidylate synthase
VISSKIIPKNDVDFTKTSIYETLTAELLTYKRQRDNARDKAAKYKSQWNETAEELKHQTSKFELLAKEFRRVIRREENAFKRSSAGSIEIKDHK